MKKLNLAVIGVGRMGLNHVRVLSKIEQAQIKAICEPNHKIAHSVAKNFFIDSVYDNIEKMLGNEELNAVIIATPTTEHKKTTIKCLEQGLHVFIEKPMATSVEEC
jgi:predicted dehydrogenase